MEVINWNLILGIAAVIFVIAISWFFRPRPRCPECKSYKVGIVKKESQSAVVGIHPGDGKSGPTAIASVQYRVLYRCNDCQETWGGTTSESR